MQALYTAALRKALHFQLLMGDFYTYLAVALARLRGVAIPAAERNQARYKLAISSCSLKFALFPSVRRNTKAEYTMFPLNFPILPSA